MQVRTMERYCNYGMTDLTPVIKAYEDALLSRFPFTRYQPMTAYWTVRSFIFTHFPAVVADKWVDVFFKILNVALFVIIRNFNEKYSINFLSLGH